MEMAKPSTGSKELDELEAQLKNDPFFAAEHKVKRFAAFEMMIMAKVEEMN